MENPAHPKMPLILEGLRYSRFEARFPYQQALRIKIGTRETKCLLVPGKANAETTIMMTLDNVNIFKSASLEANQIANTISKNNPISQILKKGR